MGILISCCKGSGDELLTPDAETKRRHMAEAAERRQKENESRGVKNPENIKRMQEKDREREKLEQMERMRGNDGGAPLRWQMN